MSILGKLFGSDKVMESGTEGVINGVDKLFLTKEEKLDNFRGLLKLYEPFKIAQRLLALIAVPPYVLAWFITFISSFFINVDAQLLVLSGTMGYVVLTIVGFYFGGGALEGFVSKAIEAGKR